MNNFINTLYFDLFGVLLGVDKEVVVQYIAQSTESSYLIAKDIVLGESFMKYERKEINFIEYYNEISKHFPKNSINITKLENIWQNSEIGELPIVSELNELLINYQIWIITNTTESHINKLKKQFLFLNKFKGIITSESAGFQKPNHKIFQYALNKSKSNIGSCIFIDDNFSNINSAVNMGILSHRYVDYKQFLNFKKKHLIN